jgi:hypothetical protein
MSALADFSPFQAHRESPIFSDKCLGSHDDCGTRQLSGKEESIERWNIKAHLGWKTVDSVDR